MGKKVEIIRTYQCKKLKREEIMLLKREYAERKKQKSPIQGAS